MTTETLPAVVPLEPITPIKPSEAIRLGCLIAPVQAFGNLTTGDGTACVMGALWIGLIGDVDPEWRDIPRGILNQLGDLPCPVGCKFDWMDTGPAHLNDDHRWSRERIADWLAEQGL